MQLENYAIVGDTHTLALVGNDGSIDWLCVPRFDSGACFAALLGGPDFGHWKLAPKGEIRAVRQRYRGATLILETELDTADGTVRLIDFMPIRDRTPNVVRIVEGVRGTVTLAMELVIRYDYGSIQPWVHSEGGRLHAVAGPDALVLATPVATHGKRFTTAAEFSVARGQRVPFTLSWHASHTAPPPSPDPEAALADTEAWWLEWSARWSGDGPYHDAVQRSLVVLKALTYAPSGGIVAAGTTSLPEDLGGVRNWDYRYCWLRDATFTLQAMLHAGYEDEARAWRDWLLRAVAGEPARLQIMYGLAGERRIGELELDWLPGYEGSRPVRVGNAAIGQRQLDVYGELMDVLHLGRCAGLPDDPEAWSVQRACLDWLESHWQEPDEGMWEVRSGRRNFTFSKIMVWAAFDRAIKSVETFGGDGPVDRWRALRDAVHADVCAKGFDPARNAFTQAYGSPELDASALLVPIVGFLPAGDPRVRGTLDAILRELVVDGFVQRYPTGDRMHNPDGLPGGEGAFLACSFWLVDALAIAGRRDEARALFDRLLAVRNPVGLLSEEYDVEHRRLVGNFPQAFSHIALVNSARNLTVELGPARQRATSTHRPCGDLIAR
ncbi:MAG TPA: glycoside hydrolase family 15 protein [Kofleriaceae bacterium]|nr:glycoside hydrolase family 15 protein [Kofleriaceae bacterium]